MSLRDQLLQSIKKNIGHLVPINAKYVLLIMYSMNGEILAVIENLTVKRFHWIQNMITLVSLVTLYCLIRGRPRWCPLLPCMVY